MIPLSSSEDEDDSASDDEDHFASRRRVKRRKMDDPGDGDDDDDDDDDQGEDLNAEKLQKNTEIHENTRLGILVMKAFKHFLQTYRPKDWTSDEAYYMDALQRMAEDTSQTLTVRYIPHLMEAHPVLAQWIAES